MLFWVFEIQVVAAGFETERYEPKSESMQPAQHDCQRIVTKCQAGRDEMRRVAVLLVFVYCFLIETMRTRFCLELEGRKECQLSVLLL